MVSGAEVAVGEDAGVSVTTWPRWVPWAIGLVLGLVVMGPALAPGVLLNLDLVVTEVAPVPRGVWGLGPELPRRVPLYLPAAWLSPILPATITIKAMMVATVAIGFAGGYRRTESQGRLAAVGAGALIAASPLLLTRLAIGHLMIALTMALLVWAYPTLLRPGRDLPRTALWCAAFACTGNVGGLVALAVVVAGLVATRGERGAKVLGLWLSTQLVWLVPGIAVFAQGAGLLDATVFATRAPGLDGYLRVLAGHGFWQDYYQVGSGQPWPAAVVGLVLACLAVLGRRGLPAEWRRPAQWLAVAGLVTAVASTTPFVEDLWAAFTRNRWAPTCESQRALPLFAVWAALTAPIGWRGCAAAPPGTVARWRARPGTPRWRCPSPAPWCSALRGCGASGASSAPSTSPMIGGLRAPRWTPSPAPWPCCRSTATWTCGSAAPGCTR
ncbi:MAG: hypothetical protein R2699_06615 [Acidimicrobiales bacterium]